MIFSQKKKSTSLYLIDFISTVHKSSNRNVMERVVGIEPTLSGRKHDILPLNYTRIMTLYNEFTKNSIKIFENKKIHDIIL